MKKNGTGLSGVVGYLGYTIRYIKAERGLVCEQRALRGILQVPQRFVWTDSSDLSGARRAIESLIKGDLLYWQACLTSGMVRDVIEPAEIAETKMVRVSIKTFVDFLLLRGYVDIPIDAKVVFLNNSGRKFLPAEYVASLTPLIEAMGEEPGVLGDPGSYRRVSPQTASDARVSLGMYRKNYKMDRPAIVEQSQSAGDEEASDLPPAEIEVERHVRDRWADIITEVRPAGDRIFYARRILGLDGRLLWTGSAWSPSGPWAVASRDVSGMLSLGVTEP